MTERRWMNIGPLWLFKSNQLVHVGCWWEKPEESTVSYATLPDAMLADFSVRALMFYPVPVYTAMHPRGKNSVHKPTSLPS